MYKYILRRILMLVPVLLGVTFIVFGLMSLAPGDPGTLVLGASAEQKHIDAYNESVGYNRPFFEKYLSFLYNMVFKLDFGLSYRSRQPVAAEILYRLPISFRLAFFGLLFSAVVGIPLGVLSAVKQYSLLDTLPSFFAMIMAAVPSFWLGMMLMYYLAHVHNLLPTYGLGTWRHMVMPTITIGSVYAASLMRYTRSSMLETIRADYVRTARAKGAPERAVIWRHAMKNGLLPVVTLLGSSFGAQIGGAIVTENLFNIAGLGNLTIVSINTRDEPTVMATSVVFAVIYNIILLLIDIVYAFIDPRIKAKYAR